METLKLEQTRNTPFVEAGEGFLRIEGESTSVDPAEFFPIITDWISKYESEKIELDVNLNYFNTVSSKLLLNMFKEVEQNEAIKTITVKWHYEEDDPEMCEAGESYDSILRRTTFQFVSHK